MRESPPPWQFHRYPVVVATGVLATAASVAYWMERDVSFLFEDAHVAEGQLWRLATSMFPHVNVVHLAFNLYWLWVFGTTMEATFGNVRTAALVLLFAVGSGAAEYALLDGGIGLSGVGYGLFGLLWILTLYDGRFRDAVDARVVTLFIFWFFLCIFTTVTGVMPVGNIAHGVGAVLGVLVGAAIASGRQSRVLYAAVTAVVCVAFVAGSTVLRPRVNLSAHGGYSEGQLGYEALLAERDEEAEKWLLRATRLDPDEPSYWFNLGIARERLEKLEQALACYKRAHELAPHNDDYASAFSALRDWIEQAPRVSEPSETE